MRAELEQYQVEPEPLWQRLLVSGVDGYSAISLAEKREWHAQGSWGRDGWNLGSWPYIIIFFRDREECYEVSEYVEGDVTIYACPTQELRDAITDELAFFHWKHRSEKWVDDYDSVEQLPAELRGPYRAA